MRPSQKLTSATAVLIELVFANFATEGVAVDAQHFGGATLVAISALQGTLDKALFKLSDGFIEKDSPIDHLRHKPFQLVLHDLRSAQ
jgi:hypothetical protein